MNSQAAIADVTTTPASASICSNFASTGVAPRWTTLGTMTVSENTNRDMGNDPHSWTITFVLAAPTGWQFNTAVNPTLGFTAEKNITAITRGAFTSTSISITVTGDARNRRDDFTISGLQVQATSTSAATGNIIPSSLTGTLDGVSLSTNFGTLSLTTPSTGTATVTIAASPSTAICSGTSVTFTTSVTNGGTLPTYQWRLNGSNISGATSATYTTTSLANTNTIACSIISDSCITTPTATSTNFTATVNATPNISSFSTSAPSSSCIDAGAVITVNSTSLGTATFAVTYNLAGANNSVGNTATLTMGASTGTFTIPSTTLDTVGSTGITITSISTSAGCSTALSTGNTATTTVNAIPTAVTVSGSGTYCGSGTITASNGGSGTMYFQNTTSLGTSTSTPSSSQIISATGAYYFRALSSGGCWSVEDTGNIIINSLPTAAPTNNGPKCGAGASVTLSANPAGGATVYAWSGPNLSSATVQNPTATPTVTATYSLTVTNGSGLSGCSPTTVYTTTVTVNSLPTAAPTNNGPICTGGTVTLTANPGGSTNTYLWSGPNLSSTTAQNPTATPTVTAVYSLTVSFGSGLPGCTSSVYTTTVTAIAGGNWLGTVSTDWFTSGNWCGGIPTTATAVLIPNGTTYYPLITTGTASANNLTIQSSASVTVTGGTLAISGAISNSGTFTASAGGTIEMNGSTAQTIPSSVFAGNTINNLTINNTGGVTLSDTLKIKGILTPAAGTFATGGYITLLSTSSQTALIAGSGSGSVTGNVTMQRYLPQGYGYKYISSPFTGATVSGLSSYIDLGATFPRLYGYNESLSTAGWVNYTADTNTLYPLKGYSANFGTSTAPVTFSLRGVVNSGTLSSTIYNNNNTYTLGFNLAGNPYPSPIDWTAASGWTKTNIDNAIYYFNSSDTNQYTGTYSSYIAGVSSDGVASNIIPAMQGFFVHVSSGSYPVTGTLGANNNVRVNSLSPYYHKVTTGADVPLVRLDALFPGNTANPDPTVIYLNDQASGNFNNETDAFKLLNTSVAVPNLYSWSGDAKKLSIKALHLLPDTNNIVPLGLQTEVDGQVIFNARNIDNMPDGVHVYFYDIHAGKVQSLQTQPQYTTYLSKGKYENRFYLMLSNKDIKDLPILRNELNAYSTGESLFVYLLSDKGDIVITNMLGQVLHRQQLTGTGYHEIKMKVSAGLYVATLYSGQGKQSKKVFIGKE
ncbi:MAG: T9SS type A sorting domain-containing protein [Taibaiella sp.]|nr:T9SS type A sorting domain-containing protein [Taibaiella sp.]